MVLFLACLYLYHKVTENYENYQENIKGCRPINFYSCSYSIYFKFRINLFVYNNRYFHCNYNSHWILFLQNERTEYKKLIKICLNIKTPDIYHYRKIYVMLIHIIL